MSIAINDHHEHYAAMCERVLPILQQFARERPSDPRADDAHAAYYDLRRLADALRADDPRMRKPFDRSLLAVR